MICYIYFIKVLLRKEYLMTFKELLNEKNFTQLRLSREADVSQSNLSIYSNYRDTLESSSQITRLKISKALNMTLKEFEEVLNLEPATIIATNKQQGDYIVVAK